MDSLTQVVLGAAVGEATLGQKVGNRAMLWGAIGGYIPDLDFLFNVFMHDIRADVLHRGFMHSLVFCILFAPIMGWLLNKLYQRKNLNASWKHWTFLSFMALVTHPLLDCHTTYGTQILWPLDVRVAYNNIFVADFAYTLPFMICVIIAMAHTRNLKRRRFFNNLGLILSTSYMALTLVFKGVAHSNIAAALEKQNIEYVQLSTQPTPLNSILWSARIETKDDYLVGAYSILDPDNDVTFTSIGKNKAPLEKYKDEYLAQKLEQFTNSWYTLEEKDGKLLFHDVRFIQMLLPDDPIQFIFSYELKVENDQLIDARKIQMRPDPEEMKGAFGLLWERILGNKNPKL